MPPFKNFKSGDPQWKKKRIIFILSILSFCIYIALTVFSIVGYSMAYLILDIFMFIGLVVFPLLFILFCRADDEKKIKYANNKILVFGVSFLWVLYSAFLIYCWLLKLK